VPRRFNNCADMFVGEPVHLDSVTRFHLGIPQESEHHKILPKAEQAGFLEAPKNGLDRGKWTCRGFCFVRADDLNGRIFYFTFFQLWCYHLTLK
jgi:hypothetical protein